VDKAQLFDRGRQLATSEEVRSEIDEAVGERQSFQPSAAELQSLTK